MTALKRQRVKNEGFKNVESYRVLQAPIDRLWFGNILQGIDNSCRQDNQMKNLVERNLVEKVQVSFFVSIYVDLYSLIIDT